jgi:preprotein translocase subunit SecA
MEYVEDFVDNLVDVYYPDNLPVLQTEIRTRLLIDPVVDRERAEELGKDGLKQGILDAAHDFYQKKEEQLTTEFMGALERYFVLSVIDDKWREHLRAMDELKEGIYLRAFGQRDPLVEYKKEAFELFSQMITDINVEVMSNVYKYFPEVRNQRPAVESRPRGGGEATGLPRERSSSVTGSRRLRFTHANTAGMGLVTDPAAVVDASEATVPADGGTTDASEPAVRQVVRQGDKIGRNDPCYCGSGKKYKHCHGR